MLVLFMKQTMNPNGYHGFTRHPPFFEGWYYKLVTAAEDQRFAIIPGVYISPEPEKSHCFVQVFHSEAEEVRYHRYPYEAFRASPDRFEIFVGPNYFSASEITLAIDDDLGITKGTLNFIDLNDWPVTVFAPGAMGWFAWAPFMECYHGVVSMDHILQGQLFFDQVPVDFSGGRGYIEKDWGKQFPSAWIWGQSNHFDQPGVSLMLSVAVIPWLGRSFAGFIIGLLYEGKIYRFATYNRSNIERLTVQDTSVDLVVRNPGHRLRIRALRVEGGLFQAPTQIEMDRRIIETLNASLEISFEKLDGEVIYQGAGRHAGLETVGDLSKLIRMLDGDIG